MWKNRGLLLYFFLTFQMLTAQSFFVKSLEGKVLFNSNGIPDVHIMNTSAGKATISNEEGRFTIDVTIGDTLLFSAVQYKRRSLVISPSIVQSKIAYITLEEFVNELDEVVVRPYNLSGDLIQDMQQMKIDPVVTASTLGLPNAYVKPLMQSERLLREASLGPFSIGMLTSIPFNPLINAISGRTKMLKKRVARDKKYLLAQRVRNFYPDSLFVNRLGIPEERIDDFMYYCEVDEDFDSIVATQDQMKILKLLVLKSNDYRKNNHLE